MSYSIINKVSSSRVPAWGNKKKYIAIHYLGVVGQSYELASDGCGAHYYIYWDGTIYQRCSHDAVPWAVGTGGYYTKVHADANNYNTISIEMCCKCDGNSSSAEDKKWYFTTETQKACVWLVQKLMKDLNIPIENVLRHRDIVNKTCPAPYVHNNKYKTSWTWDEFKNKVAGNSVSGTQASDFVGLTESQAAAKILKLARADYLKTGILASVTAAQMILESGYVKTELATKANNCFGMKKKLSGNTWANSTWDGKSIITIKTAEEYKVGNITYINAPFRKYNCIEDSIADHSAYLLGAMNGSKKRYAGLAGCKNYKKAITIIKNGGYATDSQYVSKICNIIERFGLNKYDGEYNGKIVNYQEWTAKTKIKNVAFRKGAGASKKLLKKLPKNTVLTVIGEKKSSSKKLWYKVKLSDGTTGFVFNTKIVPTQYSVKVTSDNLIIRSGAGTSYSKRGYTGKGTFTIVQEKKGSDGHSWGLLKNYESTKNGWIAVDLDCVKKI